jgi:hypothetical protein
VKQPQKNDVLRFVENLHIWRFDSLRAAIEATLCLVCLLLNGTGTQRLVQQQLEKISCLGGQASINNKSLFLYEPDFAVRNNPAFFVGYLKEPSTNARDARSDADV